MKDFFEKIPLIHPDIKIAGENFLDLLLNFQSSKELKRFENLIDDPTRSHNDLIVELLRFEIDMTKKFDDQYQNIEKLFLQHYAINTLKK